MVEAPIVQSGGPVATALATATRLACWVRKGLMSDASEAATPAMVGPWRIVSVNFAVDEKRWLDAVCERLRQAGLTKTTRSEVVRVAVAGLKERLDGSTDAQLVEFFLQAWRGVVVDRSHHDETASSQ